MAINITNLISAINAKLSGDSDGTFVLSNASKLADDITNTIKYPTFASLVTADSSNAGDIVRVGSADSASTYYISNGYSWKELVGGGSGGTEADPTPPPPPPPAPAYQGSSNGFLGGPRAPDPTSTPLQKFPFSSDTNSTEIPAVFDFSLGTRASASSSTHGYVWDDDTSVTSNRLCSFKYPFSVGPSGGSATSVGAETFENMPSAAQVMKGTQGHTTVAVHDHSYAWTIGGQSAQLAPPLTAYLRKIEYYPFSSDIGGTVLTGSAGYPKGFAYHSANNSPTNGYFQDGYWSAPSAPGQPPTTSLIFRYKFPYTTTTPVTITGITPPVPTWPSILGRQNSATVSSETDGYVIGGRRFPPFPTSYTDQIRKWPFSSDTNMTINYDAFPKAIWDAAGISSTSNGYVAGGFASPSPYSPTTVVSTTLLKFPFASDTTHSSNASLSVPASSQSGTGNQN